MNEVVASDAEKGGTWAGATEALKAEWIPVFVLDHAAMPDGNRLLLQKGGVSFLQQLNKIEILPGFARIPGVRRSWQWVYQCQDVCWLLRSINSGSADAGWMV